MPVTPSRIFLAGCLAVLAGLFLGSSAMLSFWLFVMVAVIIIVAFLGSFPWNYPLGSARWLPLAVAVAIAMFGMGMVRANAVSENLRTAGDALPFGKSVSLEGVVIKYPDARAKDILYTIAIQKPTRTRVLVFGQRTSLFSYGDVISVKGTLQRPQQLNGFDYPEFLAKDGVIATLSAKDIQKVALRQAQGKGGTLVGRTLAAVRGKTERTADAILPMQDAALLRALLIGDENTMSDEFKNALNRAGLRHIVAVSGMNITIIAGMLSAFFISLGIRRQFSFVATVVLVTFFVAAIGAPASAVRAAIMGLLLGLAPLIGRPSSGLRIITFAAAVMAFLSPLALRADLGFQLSFLAMLGIILFAEPLTKLFSFLPETLAIRSIVPMTFAAQLATLPLLIAAFGRVSFIAPVTNLLVLPLLPYATVVGFLAVGLGMISTALGSLAAFLVQPYLVFTRFVTETFASFSFAAWEGLRASTFLMVGWWGILAFAAWHIARAKRWPIDEMVEYPETPSRIYAPE